MRTKNYSNVRLRFRTADSPLTGTIRYGIGTCIHGALLVARGDDGICAILMRDKADLLHEELAEVFLFNRLEKSSTLRHDLAAVAFIDDSQPDVRLDRTVGGTAFEQRISKALCNIPGGKTRSYSELARNIGEERAARAVARACAANILAIAIPCHGVVKNDGGISGYRWGVDRKRKLLQKEGAL